MRWLDGVTDSVDTNLSKLWEIVKDRGARHAASPWGRQELDTTEQLNNKGGWNSRGRAVGGRMKQRSHPDGTQYLPGRSHSR